jgi:L,D-peptidoglycan transpeptidase YkuD (ErfK/YbiS/YcfS/YnhG family)
MSVLSYDRRIPNPKGALGYNHETPYHFWARLRRQFNFFNRWWQIRLSKDRSTLRIDRSTMPKRKSP